MKTVKFHYINLKLEVEAVSFQKEIKNLTFNRTIILNALIKMEMNPFSNVLKEDNIT